MKPQTLAAAGSHSRTDSAERRYGRNMLRPNSRWAVLVLLLAGVALRWAKLDVMNTMLHYDEAYNAMDALGLLKDPRLTPFLPGNFGRESGFVYWAIAFVALLPGNPLAMRLAGTAIGILTLAAATKLGRELLGARGAIWTLAALSVLYWHLHVSHLALRANMYLLVGTLGAAWLMRAYRTNSLGHWIIGGVTTGLLAYTYFSSVAWLGFAGVVIGLWLALNRERRRGALAAGLAAALTVTPMILYAGANPAYFFSRPDTVAALGWPQFIQNVCIWAWAWFRSGDPNPAFNLSGRPILDPFLGALGISGLALLFTLVRRRWQAPWLLIWAGLALLPSLLSNRAPHFLRAIGLTVPIAVVIGAGATALGRLLARWTRTPWLAALPLLFFLLAGRRTAADFYTRWLPDSETAMLMEAPLNEAVDLIRDQTPEDTSVYFSPFTMLHPVIGYRALELAPRPVGAFDSHQCMVLASGNSVYFSLALFEPSFPAKLSQWIDLETAPGDLGAQATQPHYALLQGRFDPDDLPAFSPTYHFGDFLHLQVVAPISDTAKAGATVPMVLSAGALQPIAQPLSIFIHLYGDPLPEAGGALLAQADSQLCATYPIHLWRDQELILQSFDLILPADLTPGTYVIAAGIYWFPDGTRLPITALDSLPALDSAGNDYVILQQIAVIK